MIYTSQSNWYQWSYNGSVFSRRTSADEIFKTHYSPANEPIGSFKEELLKAAKSTLDHYPGLKPCLFFSGGLDSELMLRAYTEIGANPQVFIVRYENDYNIYDVSHAVIVCNNLNIPYKIIDFNIQNFFENDAEQVSELSQIDRPKLLPHLKFTEVADGLILVGHSDMRWYRTDDDYSKKGTWLVQDFEHDIGCDKYNILKNRPAIFQWWKWSPGLISSYTTLEWFKKLTSDCYKGRLGITSTKILGYSEAYHNLLPRIKATGFEKLDFLISDFENYLTIKYKGLPYRGVDERTLEQLNHELGIKNR
jgi:hypothetical protein